MSGSTDTTVRYWTLPDLRPLRTLSGHKKTVAAVRVSPQEDLVASASYDSRVRLWSLPEGRSLPTISAHQRNVVGLAFSADGMTLASGGLGEEVLISEVATGKTLQALGGHRDAAIALAYTPDGSHLLSIDVALTLRLWNARTWQVDQQVQLPAKRAQSLSSSPLRDVFALGADHRILLLSWETLNIVEELPVKPMAVPAVAFSPDGRYLAAGFADQKIRVWQKG